MAHRPFGVLAGLLGAAVMAASPAAAQTAGADRRLERIERDLRTVQSIVMQAQATGQPVVVKPEGPDPALNALQTRSEDLESTVRRLNGQMETLGHDLEQTRRAEAAAEAERSSLAQLLNERLSRIEAQLTALTQSATASDPTLAEAPPPPEPPRRGGAAAGDATARAQAQDTGVLGGPPPAPPATAAESFTRARDLFTTGEHAAATAAFQDFLARYGSNARAPEAYYWLGESYYAQHGFQNATAAYANALKDRPTNAWAPAAMVRLSQALTQSNQNAQACAALAEFDQRYAAKAAAAVKTNADAVRRRARCGG